MKPVLIYSGTTEGKRLAECLAAAGVDCTVCVATEYGELVMPHLAHATVRQGRMTAEEMRGFCRDGGYLAVVDATHPFAEEASANIRESVKGSGIPCFRLKREEDAADAGWETGGWERWFDGAQACADALKEVRGNILLTTGSKELSCYAKEEEVRKRLYVRVLPSAESIRICEECGIAGKQILAMQGPFTEELNQALIRQYRIACLVTKQSGAAGGFREKQKAAQALGISCFVIGSPKEEGLSFSEVLEQLERLTGTKIQAVLQESARERIRVTLAGIGMGGTGSWTEEGKQAVREADVLFGAPRVLAAAQKALPVSAGQMFPYYQAERILPELMRLQQENICRDLRAAVLFSGDTGFYSGCRKLRQGLLKAGIEHVQICPGISCVSYLAAAAGLPWQDAAIISIHGEKDTGYWKGRLLEEVFHREAVFVLLSGAADLCAIGQLLEEERLERCRITAGYQLSYPEETIREYTPQECRTLTKEGLYVCLIRNPAPQEKPVTHGWNDQRFLRGQVPMTKEEVREIAICKLGVTEQAVVYDIGSGTGSFAAEVAARSSRIRVYAVERKPEAAELIRENCRSFHLHNVTVVEGTAPEALAWLPAPTHALIGGSGGALKEILLTLFEKAPGIRVVLTAVTLETAGSIPQIFQEIPVCEEEIVQVQISRSRTAGNYHMMQAENPVFVISFRLGLPEKQKGAPVKDALREERRGNCGEEKLHDREESHG